MSEEKEIGEQIAELTGEIRKISERRTEATKAGTADGGRAAAADDGATAVSAQLVELTRQVAALRGEDEKKASDAARKAEIEEAVKAVLKNTRGASLAGAIGTGSPGEINDSRLIPQAATPAHPALKAIFRDYIGGEMVSGFVDQLWGMQAKDFAMVGRGKAKLDELGMFYGDVPPESKATLGNTGAAGGYVLPNNLVDTVVKPSVQEAVYQTIITVRNGVNVRGVDQPYRTGAPTRMTFQAWGVTKENVDEAYGTYSAALGTMARIYDLGKQYLRFSQGAAEQDVMDELGKAAILGENFYILAGLGTGSGSSGDPTTGVYTALAAAVASYTTTFTASSSTVAGSAAAGLATAFGAMATRSRRPTAVVTDAVTYWTLFSQGSDNAGFWMSDLLGAGFQIGPDNSLRWRGVPILYDANYNTNTATTKGAIAGDWPALKLYRGAEFRIDTSDQAGTRWDQNLVGFRGEQEIGINASTAVSVGAFQRITGLIP